MDNIELKENISYGRPNRKETNSAKDISTYSQFGKKGLDCLDNYNQDYENRYAKKKGIAKWDCYCEKNIFDKINDIYILAEKMHNNKKGFKKRFYKKYGIILIPFSLLPVLGLILPMLFNETYRVKDFVTYTEDTLSDKPVGKFIKILKKGKDTKEVLFSGTIVSLTKSHWEIITALNKTFLILSTLIVLSVIIYILVKVIKYEKLKTGKDKMSLKEYYPFTKSLL
ncbi:hypothetical protein PVBG_06064 [Plasmodium vivax Brazil I]|uniref:Variable surface protein Vir35 n=1 Tax=Plasmodium vivax (strain Brazil I) TaxID=1033975 RepID=A0A0J9SJU1_PLAV1|nr:hypothetical protein PVBG_06064 [Plasmodium vivax Brazil I]